MGERQPVNRAEQLRQQRKTQTQQRLNRVAPKAGVGRAGAPAKRAANLSRPLYSSSAVVKPVVTRMPQFGKPLVNSARTNVRKRVTIPLNSPGVQVALPSVPVLHPGWRILSGAVAIFSAVLMLVMSVSTQFRITRINLEGITRVSPADIGAVAGVTGLPVYMVDTGRIKAGLEEAFPDLYDLTVEIALPALVTIRANERQALVAWLYNGQTLLIDADGFVFPQRAAADLAQPAAGPQAVPDGAVPDGAVPDGAAPPELPPPGLLLIAADGPPPAAPPPPLSEEEILKKPIEEEDALSEEQKKAQDLLKEKLLQRRTDPMMVKVAQELVNYMPPGTALVYSSKEGLGWSDPQGWNVFIGTNLSDLKMKMAEYQAIVDHLTQQGIRPAMISIEHTYAPFYRLE